MQLDRASWHIFQHLKYFNSNVSVLFHSNIIYFLAEYQPSWSDTSPLFQRKPMAQEWDYVAYVPHPCTLGTTWRICVLFYLNTEVFEISWGTSQTWHRYLPQGNHTSALIQCQNSHKLRSISKVRGFTGPISATRASAICGESVTFPEPATCQVRVDGSSTLAIWIWMPW